MTYDKARQKSRAAIKNAMLALMQAKPLGSITVTELCRRCRLNRSTFYAYYPTMEHLIHDLHTDLFLQMEIDLHLERGNYGMRDKALFTSFLANECQSDSRFTLFLRSDEANLFVRNMVAHFLSRLCPQDASVAQRNSLLYHMTGAFTLLCKWIYEGYPCPAEELAEQIMALSSSNS